MPVPVTTHPDIVEELVERFHNNRESYKTSSYKEFRLRREFVDPLFQSLDWDVGNAQGYAEAYKDVVLEDTVKIGGASKAPDYAFRIGGTRKFFVETKAPSTVIKDSADSAFQLRRYGWSAKLPVSILTNFEEFSVYDCRIKPDKSDKASKARILYFTYKDYPARWGDLKNTFSKTAIAKGAFDKFVDDATRTRGTAEVDTSFLAEIERWRESLAKNIALRNPTLSGRELNTAVQRTIDRIIFLRIAEDRGIEPYGRLQTLASQKQVYQKLCDLFRQADSRYNSGLFHFDPSDGLSETLDTFTLNLTIDDAVIKELFTGLYYPDSPYEFSVLPADILGQVYEQFLGKVIRLSGKSAVIEEKPDVKKAGGVFYTPTFVTKYIVRGTLDRALAGKTPEQIAGTKVRSSTFRILDPACGSGSFLIEAFQYLLDWHRDYYMANQSEKHAKGKTPKLHKAQNNEWRLTIAEKRRILLTHIYGVDIDAQAVEVTKLSLLLKVLEGESADLIAAQMNLFHMRALPDLGGNIKCGNSLVGHDYYEFCDTDTFTQEQRIKVNAFDWATELPFRFDLIVGNPPYGADYTNEEKNYFQDKFSHNQGKPETYLFFIEQSLRLLRPGGLLGYIVPNAWQTNYYGLNMRRQILEKATVIEIADLEPVKVFKAATVDTAIVVLRNTLPDPASELSVTRIGKDRAIRPEFIVSQKTWTADPEMIFNVYAAENALKIMLRMQAGHRTLSEIVEFSQGVIPYLNKAEGVANAYIAPSSRGSEWRQLYESASQVDAYRLAPTEAFIRYGKWLCRSREPRFFDNPKILFHRVRKKLPLQLVGALDTSQAINRHSLSNMILLPGHPEAELWAVLALFNSQLVNWWFVHRYGPLMEVGVFKVQTIPLPSNWTEIWPAIAEKSKLISDALRSAADLHDNQARSTLEREAASHRRKVETLLAEAYGLSDSELQYTAASFARMIDRSASQIVESGLDEDIAEGGTANDKTNDLSAAT